MQHRAVEKQDYHFMYIFYIILPLVTYIKLLFAMLETSVYFFSMLTAPQSNSLVRHRLIDGPSQDHLVCQKRCAMVFRQSTRREMWRELWIRSAAFIQGLYGCTLEPVCHCVLFIVQVGNVSLLSQVLLILIELKV